MNRLAGHRRETVAQLEARLSDDCKRRNADVLDWIRQYEKAAVDDAHGLAIDMYRARTAGLDCESILPGGNRRAFYIVRRAERILRELLDEQAQLCEMSASCTVCTLHDECKPLSHSIDVLNDVLETHKVL